ncbi:DNA pilot protein [Dipodfec virus UOA04_Rod_742]|nr:DNA pilot protein [Dipodfec virus UOA04_Rod_742]
MGLDWKTIGTNILSDAPYALMGLGSFGINSASSSRAAKKAYKYNSRLMDKQFNLTRQLNQHAYLDTTNSMREAGINPMLAISNGVNGLSAGSGGSVGVTPAQVEDGASSAMAYKSLKNETELKDSQKHLNNSAESLNNYLGDKAHEESALAREQTKLTIDYGAQEAEERIKQIKAGTRKIENDIQNNTKLANSAVSLNKTHERSNVVSTAKTQKESDNIRKIHGPRIEAGRYGSFGLAW